MFKSNLLGNAVAKCNTNTSVPILDVVYNVKYTLSSSGEVRLDFSALVTAATPINLANHVYFNLAGHSSGATGAALTRSA